MYTEAKRKNERERIRELNTLSSSVWFLFGVVNSGAFLIFLGFECCDLFPFFAKGFTDPALQLVACLSQLVLWFVFFIFPRNGFVHMGNQLGGADETDS